MGMILKMLAAMAVTVFVVDLSGFTESWRSLVSRWMGGRPLRRLPPFDCSLCMTWWVCVAVSILSGEFGVWSLPLSAAFALLAKPFGGIVSALLDLLGALPGLIDKLTNKISR